MNKKICGCLCAALFLVCVTSCVSGKQADAFPPAGTEQPQPVIAVEQFAFDSHLHILPLSHINVLEYMMFLSENKLDLPASIITAPEYLFKPVRRNPVFVFNALSALERTPDAAIALYENDLRGAYVRPDTAQTASGSDKPFLSDDGFLFSGRQYEYLVIMPLVMDFTVPNANPDLYYQSMPDHDVIRQAGEILSGIQTYRRTNPDSRLIVRPYMGINPRFWSPEELSRMLSTHFGAWSGNATDEIAAWNVAATAEVNAEYPYPNAFAGIKVYPPLNFDPWPDEPQERRTLEILYAFCEQKGIPIITHCDDQGFRQVPVEESFLWTSPERWEKVLAQYPQLYIDIAHFGRQYYSGLKRRNQISWQQKIIELMLKYPHVYTDVSFSGTDESYWTDMLQVIGGYPEDEAEIIRHRILFGTDWPLCLTKIESATAYYRQFESSPVPDRLKHLMLSENPHRFHFR